MNPQTSSHVRIIIIAIAQLVMSLTVGCSTVCTSKAVLDQPPKGVRVYAPKVYFLVNAEDKETTVMVLPDYHRAYDIKPITVFSKQDFKVDLDEGQLKSFQANQDTTSILTFFKEGATLAAKAAGVAVSAQKIKGDMGLPSGLYVLNDDGSLGQVQKK